MSEILITDARLAGSDKPLSVVVKNGSIEVVADRNISETCLRRIALDGSYLFPGFVDIHNQGAVGVDVNTASVDDLIKVAGFLAGNGVTAWLPTLVPDSDENYSRAINAINELMARQAELAVAQAVGVHYEGVFANEKMCGALRPEYFRSGRWAGDGGQLPKPAQGACMTTLAPEIEGGIEVIKELVKDGWIVSIGHTKADSATLDAAFNAGAKHLTHFFNAMTGVHHRDIGVAGWGLATDQITFDIIADGVHVHPKMLELACRSKGTDKVSLISDSVAPTGLGDGEFDLWGETIAVSDGRTQNERGSIAGSVCTMNDCVRTMRSLGFSDVEIVKMSSSNPAAVLRLDSNRGSIEAGKRADLVAIDTNGDIRMTMIGGKVVE